MDKLSLEVQKQFREECSLALRRFIGKMDVVGAIEVESGRIVIDFNAEKITEKDIMKISKASIEKPGYKLLDEGKNRGHV